MTTKPDITPLERVAADAGQRLSQSLAKLTPYERQLVVTLTAQVQSLLSVGQLALFGYEGAHEGHTRFGGVSLSPPTLAWAQGASRPKAAVVVIGSAAATLASLLEGFVVEWSAEQALELSRRSDGAEWVRDVEARLGVDLGGPAREALASVVDVRRAFAMELDALPPSHALAQSYAAWPSAVVVLAEALVARRAGAVA
ncbi:MAG: hypothetical protein KF915_17025 [Polyangiaceae bacterium]|nr:hypothetical protein [Polyangiaceae bacterium]